MNDSLAPAGFANLKRYVSLLAWLVVILTLLSIPLKIISLGYLPSDDALRHAAKGVSGKSWSEILILNPAYKIDHEFGWNLLLEKIHQWTGCDTEHLVIFSVVGLFLVWSLSALPWLKWPEAWLVALLLSAAASDEPERFLTGRPFTLTAASLISILFLWQKYGAAPPREWMLALMTLFVALSTYFHGTWYLWVLPIVAFFLAERCRWGISLFACWIIGVGLGSCLTGHPLGYPLQAVTLAHLALGLHPTAQTMASELRPYRADMLAAIIFGALLVMRQVANLKAPSFLKNPAFWLALMAWILGFKVARFWADWGWPALLVLIAGDVELLLASRVAADDFRRLLLVGTVAAGTFLCITSDLESRWTSGLTKPWLRADDPKLNGWLPDRGGVFYTAEMALFYDTFYSNPHGDWRYMLGFEPTWMPKEDFEIYHKIVWNGGDSQAYEPWVHRMTLPDRLAISGSRGAPPQIPELEWNYAVTGVWLGRLPRPNAPPPAPTIPATAPR